MIHFAYREKIMKALLVLVSLSLFISPDFALASKQLSCKLDLTDGQWAGPCGKFNGKNLSINIREGARVTSGRWRSDVEATEVWVGTMMNDGQTATRSIEIEHYQTEVVFARTTFGWVQVSDWSQSEDRIEFEIHMDVPVAPSKLDLLIVRRAGEILADEEAWNRKDNRKCPKGAAKWSIYCAMRRASVDVTGGSHHRRPALQEVRKIIQERSKSRRYRHPLMDYNNDKRTRIEDVHSVFTEAGETIIQSLLSGKNQ
jgi:hypothetical protein